MRLTRHQMRCGHGLPPGVGCKHQVSAHSYHPDPAGRTNIGPQECSIPGCACAQYVDPRTYAKDRLHLSAMRQLGVSWKKGHPIPTYPSRMGDAQRKAADKHYDAMSDGFLNLMATGQL